MDAERLKILRKSYKLSQAQLAERLGKSRLTVHNWEKGKFALPGDIVEQLSKADLREAVPNASTTKAEQARQAAEAKLIEFYVTNYRQLRAWPDIPNHNAAMRFRAKNNQDPIPSIAYPAILAEWPDILSDPDGNYTMTKEQSRAIILGVDKA